MIFEQRSQDHVVVPLEVFLEWKDKAKKYEDLMQEEKDRSHPKKEQGVK
ncbi:MAG: hypothetical protein H0Z34_06945 [Brevibacillus sp.]|nr:hypothetical protein [Brevibacillus sp.]